ncbi:MAG TPA: TrkA family potassium uptake protein [Anaerolineaceae bacterium]
MRVLVIGCGRLGSELAYRLYKSGHEVSIIDIRKDAFFKLPADFIGVTHEGDAMGREVLNRAGIEHVDALVVVTGSDVLNAVVGYIGREIYHIPNVVVRNYDPQYRYLFEAFDLQVVSALSWGAQRMEEMITQGNIRTVFSAGNGEVEVYEIIVPQSCHGVSVKSILNANCIPVAITRSGRSLLPNQDMLLEPGDVIMVSATMEGARLFSNRLCEMTQEA